LPKANATSGQDADLYALYDELDRLEELLEDLADHGDTPAKELREEMNGLGVSSAEEAERRIVELNERIDELEGAEG
jgi:hypothetical protein